MDDQLSLSTTPNSLAEKVFIVTGAVGNLGLATADALHEAAAKTVLVDHSNDRLREQYPGLID